MRLVIKDNIVGILISSSLILLTAFLVFWLKNVYRDQAELLQQEVNLLFTQTINEQQDSLVSKVIIAPMKIRKRWKSDSLDGRLPKKIERIDKEFTSSVFIRSDSAGPLHKLPGKHNTLKIIVDSLEEDGLEEATGMLSSVVLSFQSSTIEGADTTFQIRDDSLRISNIEQLFQLELDSSRIGIPFQVVRFPDSLKINDYKGLSTKTVKADFPTMHRYQARFSEHSGYLFRKILPQVSFAVLLLFLTSGSFWLIYYNLRKQREFTAIKNDFISNVTHELKTPITTVSVAIEALSNFNALNDPEKTKDYLDISRNELNRLSMLVDKVLKMSVFEQKEPEFKIEKINLKSLVQIILNSMKLQFDHSDALVDFRHEGEDFTLEGDRVHLTSVIYNLLDNALKYSKEKPRINIDLTQTGQVLRMSITDQGLGIPQEYQEKIFDKFFRIPTGDRHNVKGHGLGLSYVASVIRKHSGTIAVESQPTVGSRFTINLPKEYGTEN